MTNLQDLKARAGSNEQAARSSALNRARLPRVNCLPRALVADTDRSRPFVPVQSDMGSLRESLFPMISRDRSVQNGSRFQGHVGAILLIASFSTPMGQRLTATLDAWIGADGFI